MASLVTALLLSALPTISRAQTVQGRLVDPATQEPVEGALVLLLDESGEESGGFLSNQAGRFLIEAPGPGQFKLRVERIGYETTESDFFALEDGMRLGMDLDLATRAIELEAIQVEADQQCVVRPGEGAQLAVLWEEARKALTAQDWTERQGMYRFQITRYRKNLDITGQPLEGETPETESAVLGSPLESSPAHELLSRGFIQRDGEGGYEYFGVDASVLLADEFLDSHCFRLEPAGDRLGEVGLAFEPVSLAGVPDIEGVLWIDAPTGELRTLEYGYTWAPWPAALGAGRGFTRFETLPNGAWVIRDWWIRMPRMEIRSTTVRTPGDDGMRLAGLTEVGGSTNRVIPSSEALPLTPTAGILEGRVWDSPRSAPLSGATVFLSGTQHSTTSDQNGAFFFPDLPAGTFSLAFTHPRLDSLHVFPRGIDVVIQPGEVTTARLEIPGHPGADPVGCSDADLSSHPGAMSGFVRLDPSGDPATGAVIRVSWSTFEVRGGGTFVEQRHEATTETDASGRYLLCGVPTDATLTVQASFGSHKGRAVQIQADPDGLTEMNFEIGGGN